jgi:hypothetical protein
MTSNPNYIAPQSASAPITTNLRKDELAALLTVEQGATAQQRIAATGNSIPLVFCRQAGGVGGAWVTPPAVRYGVEENANTGDYFAFGLVISDGQIPAIAEADVWKGPVRVNTLSGYGITNAYNTLPASGYNYTLSSIGPDTPATSTTNTETINYADTNVGFAFAGDTYTLTVTNCTKISFENSDVRFSADPNAAGGYLARWEAYSGNTLLESSDGTYTGNVSKTYTFATPTTFKWIRTSLPAFPGYLGSSSGGITYATYSSLEYTQKISTTITTPFVPGAVTNLPLFAGSGGSFAGMSTLAVRGRYAVDAETGIYKQQVRCFVRNGVQIDRVLGGSGSSCSFPDLAYYLLKNANKVSTQLIDLPSFQGAERFNAKYELFFNGVLANSVNLRDYLTRVAPLFLLRFVQINGKFGLKPVLPLDGAFNVSTAVITPVHVFNDGNIVAGTYQKEYIDINQRKPFCALMTWRAQTDSVYGTPRTNEVRYANTAIDGPFEQYDMEEFCTTENHATLIGRYILASRKLTTHTVSFQTTELIGNLAPTDIISTTWDYGSSFAAGESKTIFYQVDTVTEGANGIFSVEATHFPTTAAGVSQVALDMLTGI